MCGVLCGPADPDQRLPCAYSRIWPLFTCFISFPLFFLKQWKTLNARAQASGRDQLKRESGSSGMTKQESLASLAGPQVTHTGKEEN